MKLTTFPVKAIEKKIEQYNSENKKMFITSSFQTHSIAMLDIISKIDKTIPVYFINTGFHFAETIRFKEEVTERLNLNVIDLKSFAPKCLQTDFEGKLLFTSDPDYCCYLNKVQPMEPLLMSLDVWVNGVRGDQSGTRKNFNEEEMASHNTLRYHPMLKWNSKMIYDYIKANNLPKHPLEDKGYVSIGCEPCTRKFADGDIRNGRWFGMKKTECGLNTELITKSA